MSDLTIEDAVTYLPRDRIDELVKVNILKRYLTDEESMISFQLRYVDTYFKEVIFKTLEFPNILIEPKI